MWEDNSLCLFLIFTPYLSNLHQGSQEVEESRCVSGQGRKSKLGNSQGKFGVEYCTTLYHNSKGKPQYCRNLGGAPVIIPQLPRDCLNGAKKAEWGSFVL